MSAKRIIDDFVVENDHLDAIKEQLVKEADEIFKKMNPAIFKRSWINTGLIKEEEYKENIDQFEDLDVAESILEKEKEKEEELVEHFLEFQIDENKAVSPIEVEEPLPKKQSKITSFFK